MDANPKNLVLTETGPIPCV